MCVCVCECGIYCILLSPLYAHGVLSPPLLFSHILCSFGELFPPPFSRSWLRRPSKTSEKRSLGKCVGGWMEKGNSLDCVIRANCSSKKTRIHQMLPVSLFPIFELSCSSFPFTRLFFRKGHLIPRFIYRIVQTETRFHTQKSEKMCTFHFVFSFQLRQTEKRAFHLLSASGKF